MQRRTGRIQRDLQQIFESPQPSVAVWPNGDEEITARLTGPENSPFVGGSFHLSVTFPERYPFEPPHVTFKTKIHHPNIDSQGRICLDLLKLPPQGTWRPHINLSTVLTSILLLMTEPNPNDPLDPEIAEEFKSNRALFDQKARKLTQTYATDTEMVQPKIEMPENIKETEQSKNIALSRSPAVVPESSDLEKSQKMKVATVENVAKPVSVAQKNPVPPTQRPTGGNAKRDPFAILGKRPKH